MARKRNLKCVKVRKKERKLFLFSDDMVMQGHRFEINVKSKCNCILMKIENVILNSIYNIKTSTPKSKKIC